MSDGLDKGCLGANETLYGVASLSADCDNGVSARSREVDVKDAFTFNDADNTARVLHCV